LADDPIAIAHQVDQEIEYLRLGRNRDRTAQQFAPVRVQTVVVKEKLHLCPRACEPAGESKGKSNPSEAQIKRWAKPSRRASEAVADSPGSLLLGQAGETQAVRQFGEIFRSTQGIDFAQIGHAQGRVEFAQLHYCLPSAVQFPG